MIDADNKQIKVAGLISYITIAFNIITGLLYTPWMIHKIGDEHYALYTMAISIVNMFLLDFGLGSATSKFIAEAKAKKDSEKVNQYIANTFFIYTVISAIFAVCLLIVGFFLNSLYANLSFEELKILKDLYIFVSINSLLLFPCTTFTSALNGTGMLIQLKISILVQKVLNVILIVIALSLGMGVYSLVSTSAVTTLIMVSIQYFYLKRSINIKIKFNAVNIKIIKQIATFSVWFLISQVCERLTNTLAPSIIGIFLSTTEVTLFSLSITLERYVYTFATGINGLFLPKVTNIVYSNDFEINNIFDLMVKVGRIVLALVGGIFVGFIFEGKDFVLSWMGQGYEVVYYGALIFMIPLVILSSQRIAYTYLMVINKIKYQSFVDIVSSIAGFVMLLVLPKYLGVIGAIVALTLSSIVNNIIMNVLFCRIARLNMKKFWKSVYFRWVIVAFISLLFSRLMYIDSISGWGKILANGFIFIIVYGLLIWLLYFDKDIKKTVLSFVKHK